MDTYSHEQITKPSIATGDDAQSLSEDLSIGSVSGSLSFSEARVRRPRQNFSGRTVGERYKLEAQLGRGGMATVYRAIDLKLNKPVAVKILNPEHFDAYARRLSEEARAVSQLLHDHIVTVSDVGTDSEHSLAFFVMELIEGRDLGSVLWREGPLAWTSVVEIGKQICGALEAAHARGIIHRDIKPANCMLLDGPGINIKVLDFGIAKFTELYLEHRPEVVWSETAHDLPTLGLVGTPGYVAPEQLERSADDPRVDIYGLGAMLYRLLTNKMPMPQEVGETELPLPLATAVGERRVPRRLAAVIVRALSVEPEQRFPSAVALRQALASIVGPASVVPATLNVAYRKGVGHWVSRTLMLAVPVLAMVAAVKFFGPGEAASPLEAASGPQQPRAEPLRANRARPTLAAAGSTTTPAANPTTTPGSEPEPGESKKSLVASTKPEETDAKSRPPTKRKKTPKQQLRALQGKVNRCFRDGTKNFPSSAEYVDVLYEISDERVEKLQIEGFGLTRMPDCLLAKIRKMRFEGVKGPKIIRMHYTVSSSR